MPVNISIVKDKDEVAFYFKNAIAETVNEAESNGIGLKTCKRLSRFVASDFDCETDGKYFTVRLSLKLGKGEKQNTN